MVASFGWQSYVLRIREKEGKPKFAALPDRPGEWSNVREIGSGAIGEHCRAGGIDPGRLVMPKSWEGETPCGHVGGGGKAKAGRGGKSCKHMRYSIDRPDAGQGRGGKVTAAREFLQQI